VRLRSLSKSISLDGWAMIAIAAAVILGNALYLLDFTDPNPLGLDSGLTASLLHGYLSGGPTIDPSNGYISQALGHRAMLDVVHFHAPWWNPFEGTGAPLFGETESATLFPPTILLLLSNGQLYEHILLELVAGYSTYFLLRRLSLNRWACAAGGIAFALNGTFSWLAHAPFNPVAFLPLLLLGIERAYAAGVEGRRGGWGLFALAGVLSAYAGFPETAYIDTLLAILWIVWRGAGLRGPALRAFAVKLGAGVLAGALLSAPLLIAGIGYANHGYLGSNQTGVLGHIHLPGVGLPQLILPYVYGPIFAFSDPHGTLISLWGSVGGYLTTTLLLFAGLGLFSRGRRGLRIVLAAWILLAFSRMYGQIPVLGHVLGWLPDMAQTAFYRFAAPSLELAVIVLAAIGIDDVVRVPEHRRRLVWASGGMLLVVIAAGLEAHSLFSTLFAAKGETEVFAVSLVWGAGLPLVAGALALRRSRALDVRLLAGLLAVDALAMFAVPQLSAPRTVQPDPAPVAFLRQHLGLSRFATLGPFQPDYGSYYGLASVNSNDNPTPAIFAHYVKAELDPFVSPSIFVGTYGGDRSRLVPSPTQELVSHLPGYRAAGVSYVLTPPGQLLPQSPGGLTLVARTPSAWIYNLAGSAPFFDAPGCRVTSEGWDSATVSCPAASTLVRRETDLPGWSTTVSGRDTPIARTAGLFQSVPVGGGTHRVRFSYSPPGILWGGLGFLAGLLLLGAGRLRPRGQPRNGSASPSAGRA
jgi:hypothetical protein